MRTPLAGFKRLSIDPKLLPKRLYAGRANGRIRYFHIKMPVAVEGDRAIFAYIDPGMGTRSPLHCWGQAHRQLWDKLRQASRTVEVFAVAWDQQHLDRTQRVLQAWTTRDTAAARTEAVGLRQAIADADWDTVERHGGLGRSRNDRRFPPLGVKAVSPYQCATEQDLVAHVGGTCF